jgi:hypothetical protein
VDLSLSTGGQDDSVCESSADLHHAELVTTGHKITDFHQSMMLGWAMRGGLKDKNNLHETYKHIFL